MKLWLVRHADAGPHSADPAVERTRELTDDAKEYVEALAELLARQDVQPRVILASNYARAAQTADIIGKRLGVNVDLVDELNPHMPMDGFLAEILGSEQMKRVMVVAHADNTTPTMSALDGSMGDCARPDDDDDDKWPPLVKGEVRRLSIDRDCGDWECMWRVKPSDLGYEDEA